MSILPPSNWDQSNTILSLSDRRGYSMHYPEWPKVSTPLHYLSPKLFLSFLFPFWAIPEPNKNSGLRFTKLYFHSSLLAEVYICLVATLPFTQFSPLGNTHIFTHTTYHIIYLYHFLRHLWCLLSKIPRHLWC